MTVDYIDELVFIRREAVWKNFRASPADSRAVFSANTVRLRVPQGSAELAVGITLAAAGGYDVQTTFIYWLSVPSEDILISDEEGFQWHFRLINI
jgi:hypothetical protein